MAAPRSTQAARRQATRARLLEAAFQVFAAQGYTGATVDAIVQAAGYSKGAFYFHFSSKEEVFLEVLWTRAKTEEQSLRQAGDNATGKPLELLRGVAGFLGPGGDDTLWPALVLEFWSHASRNPRVREGVGSVSRFRREALLSALNAVAEAGALQPYLKVDDCADLLLTLSDGLTARAGSGQDGAQPTYLPQLIAGVLGIPLGPRAMAGAPAAGAAKERTKEPAAAKETPLRRTGTG